MRVNRIIKRTYAEGPGLRYCIYTQGCSHQCNGCFAKDLWDYSGGKEVGAKDIISDLSREISKLRGVTFLGGEPFDQCEELSQVASFAGKNGLDVITFTGYKYSDLLKEEKYSALILNSDLIIDGEFEKDKLDYSRPLAGSSNQNFIFLTDKISKNEIKNYKNRFEVRVGKNGIVYFNGMGNIEKFKKYVQKI